MVKRVQLGNCLYPTEGKESNPIGMNPTYSNQWWYFFYFYLFTLFLHSLCYPIVNMMAFALLSSCHLWHFDT